MDDKIKLILAVFVPVVGACVLPLVGRMSKGTRNAMAFLMVAASLVCACLLVPTVITGDVVSVNLVSGPLGIDFSLRADGLAVFVGIVSSLLSAIILLYSTGYISHYGHQNEYYLMVVLFLGSMMGLVFSANLILLYVFWELTALASWRLIGFFRDKPIVVKADKAFMVTVFGALMMLLGFVAVYAQTGTFDLVAIKAWFANPANGNPYLSGLATALILCGILSKSATLPFHTWLPDAGVAPSPVTALLHAAVLVKIGVYVYARLFVVTFPISPQWHTYIIAIAAASALVSAAAALIDTDLKRIIAYSTISQIAFIFLGFASWDKTTAESVGVVGALLYILMHGIAKGGLFLCAGIVEQNTHTKNITQMGGLIRTMPVTAIAFLLCALSVMGVPPFGGFFSKYMVINGGLGSGHLLLTLTFLFGAVLTILYLYRAFNMVFLGEPKLAPVKEGSPIMVACVALLGLMSLASGLLIWPSSEFALRAVNQMLGIVGK